MTTYQEAVAESNRRAHKRQVILELFHRSSRSLFIFLNDRNDYLFLSAQPTDAYDKETRDIEAYNAGFING